jgi:hypothetical protein
VGEKGYFNSVHKVCGKESNILLFQLDISGKMTGRIEIAITREINATPFILRSTMSPSTDPGIRPGTDI